MPRPFRSLRYRRCPECGMSRPASEFGAVTNSTPGPCQGQRRECPQCGFTGPLAAFQIAERPAKPHEGMLS
jgi:rubredoxin